MGKWDPFWFSREGTREISIETSLPFYPQISCWCLPLAESNQKPLLYTRISLLRPTDKWRRTDSESTGANRRCLTHTQTHHLISIRPDPKVLKLLHLSGQKNSLWELTMCQVQLYVPEAVQWMRMTGPHHGCFMTCMGSFLHKKY